MSVCNLAYLSKLSGHCTCQCHIPMWNSIYPPICNCDCYKSSITKIEFKTDEKLINNRLRQTIAELSKEIEELRKKLCKIKEVLNDE